MTCVLVIGYAPDAVDYSDPLLPKGIDEKKVAAGIEADMDKMRARGWQSDHLNLWADEDVRERILGQLAANAYDCVVIGGGVRVTSTRVAVLETVSMRCGRVHRRPRSASTRAPTRAPKPRCVSWPRPRPEGTGHMDIVIVALNALVSVASAVFAIVAVADPSRLSGSQEAAFGERYYAQLYAIRTVPVELAAAIIPIFVRGTDVALLLLGAAAIQSGDAIVAVRTGKRTMIAGAAVATIVHLLCAAAIR